MIGQEQPAPGSESGQPADQNSHKAESSDSKGFFGEIVDSSFSAGGKGLGDLVLRATSPSSENVLARIETVEGGRIRAIFPYPITLSQMAAPFHLHADGLVLWVKRRAEHTNNESEDINALISDIEEMEIYAEGHVWISFGTDSQKFTTRASRAFLTINNSLEAEGGVVSTLRGIFDDINAHSGEHKVVKKTGEEGGGQGIALAGDDYEDKSDSVDRIAATGDLSVRRKKKEGFALEQGERIFLKARRMRIRDINNRNGMRTDLYLEEPIASRSSLAIPSFSFRAKAMRVEMRPTRNIATLRDPSLWIHSSRMFKYDAESYSHDLDSRFPVQRFSFSDSDAFGTSFRLKVNVIDAYDYLVDPEPTFRPFALSPEFDYFSSRGIGFGLEGEYDRLRPFENGFRTWFHGYSIKDDGDDRQIGRDLGFFPLRRAERGRVKGYTQWRFGNGFRLDGHIDYQSDQTFVQEFFEDEFDRNEQDRTFLRLSRAWQGRGFYFGVDVRARDFIDEVESIPAFGFVTHRENVGPTGLGLQFSAEAEMGVYRLHLDDTTNNHDETDILRGRLEATLHRPFDFGAFLLEPFVGGRLQFSDKRFVSGGTPNQRFDEALGFRPPASDATLEEDLVVNPHLLFGANLQTNFSRTYASVRSEFFSLNGLRHTITPSIRWHNAIGPSGRELEMVQIDEYSAQRNLNQVVFSLRNRFQTRRKIDGVTQNVDFADILIEAPLYPNSDRDNLGKLFGPVEVQGRFRPHETLAIDAGIFLDPHDFDWTRWYFALKTDVAKTDISAFYRALRDQHEVLGFATNTRFSSTYSLGFEYEYDFRSGKSRDFVTRVSRTFFETFSFHLKARRDGIRKDVHFSLSLSANFGPASYQRDDN